jgi:uncharacterized membrane protein
MTEALPFLRFVHLVAAAVWLGGMIVLAALVMAFRREGVDRSILQIAARQFGRVSWTAMVVAVVTGLAQMHAMHLPWSYGPLHLKLGLVVVTVVVALVHTKTAKNAKPAARGAMEGILLLLSLGIFFAAVRL